MVSFYKAQTKSPKFCVRFLIKLAEIDKRTVLGKTLDHIRTSCGLTLNENQKLTPSLVKKSLKYKEIKEDEQWRIPVLKELIETRDGEQVIPGFTNNEINEMLDFLCID